MQRSVFVFICLLLTVFLPTVSAEAQQQNKIARIGFLAINSVSSSATSVEAFRLGLRQLGYIEGQNIIIEWRYADGRSDRLPDGS
jgi:putative tryptophan/tyrosine transport system substrate-binding protein